MPKLYLSILRAAATPLWNSGHYIISFSSLDLISTVIVVGAVGAIFSSFCSDCLSTVALAVIGGISSFSVGRVSFDPSWTAPLPIHLESYRLNILSSMSFWFAKNYSSFSSPVNKDSLIFIFTSELKRYSTSTNLESLRVALNPADRGPRPCLEMAFWFPIKFYK